MAYLSYNELPEIVRGSFEKQLDETSKKEEFHRNRSGLFTASEIHKLMTPSLTVAKNKTSRDYIFEKAYEKLTGQNPKLETFAKAMEWGNTYEPFAIRAYEELTNNVVSFHGEDQKFLKHKKLPIGAYPDGVVLENIPLECKCPANGAEHFKNISCGKDVDKFKKLRFEYYIQVQTQIMLSEVEFGHFFTFRPNIDIRFSTYHLIVPRCQEVITLIEETVKDASEQMDEIMETITLSEV